ncbi:putative monooxygenase p33MONOX [Protopterus annectens]|uniref:putative monooxygenase p33MONOX n=1 Tax=Protopterus annectens TaxID=7888 RepID=UPI001CFA25C8|nr:putative monooxygenase p33MONOX [Protopterus annectens]
MAASRQPAVPAIEHSSGGILGKMTLPVGMHRHAFCYDDAIDDPTPMTPPDSDMGRKVLWKQPVIPERKYQVLSKLEEGENTMPPSSLTPSSSSESIGKANVVKAKATSIIMNTLMTKQTQESIQKFEQQAGLRDTGYTPHKGLTAEETNYHRVAEALHKLKMQSGEAGKDERSSSAQSTPSSTPQSSPKQKRRGWFSQGSTTSLPGIEHTSTDPGITEGTSSDKWNIFGPRAIQKSASVDPVGFAVQSYKGAQKPTPMELMRAQATRIAEDPANFRPPKMDISVTEVQKPSARAHNLKPRDINVLAPSGY